MKIATFQGRIKEGNISHSVQKIKENLDFCDKNGVDILCMPESYLHGYFEKFSDAMENSINLNSHGFHQLCAEFSNYKTTLIVGLNEEENAKVCNTAVVIENGVCIGKYRKAYTYTPYDYFECGSEFPVFEKNGVKYGVIICFDAAFLEPSRILALNGAQIIFCPSFNRTKDVIEQNITEYLDKRTNFACRAYENRVWFVSSDVVWDPDGSSVCAGYAAIVDNKGNFTAKGNKFQEEILVQDIPISSLRTYSNELIFSGKKLLTQIMQDSYSKYIEERNRNFKLTFELLGDVNADVMVEIKSLLKKAMYFPTDEKMEKIIQKFTNAQTPEFKLFCAVSQNIMSTALTESNRVGLMAVQTQADKIVIHFISTKEELRGRGVGMQMIDFIQNDFSKPIEAETDDDAVSFYRKLGFQIETVKNCNFKTVRYKCVKL